MFYLQGIKARNWRAHSSIEILFHPLSNLLRGNDDVGKTSILKCIAWCLGLGTRIANERDIKNGTDETEATLTIGVRSADGAVTSHTIERRMNRKGQASVKIDGKKVGVAAAIEILTREWGLPHPEQLVGMIWLRQQRLDALVREDPLARQERFRALLGFGQLRDVLNPLDRTLDQLNAKANNERALGIDTREIEHEAQNLSNDEKRLLGTISSFPAEEESREMVQALRHALSRIEAATAETAAEQLIAGLPAILNPWVDDLKASQAPDLQRLGYYAEAVRDLENQRKEYRAQCAALQELPTAEFYVRMTAAIRDAISRLEIEQARGRATTLRHAAISVAAELEYWLDDALAGGATPDIARLTDFAQSTHELSGVAAKLSRCGDPVQLRAEAAFIDRWLLHQDLQQRTATTLAAVQALPTHLQDWARQMQSQLAQTRHLPRDERILAHRQVGIVNAGTLCERNSAAREAVRLNGLRADLTKRITDLLGDRAPDAPVRSQLRQHHSLTQSLATFVAALQLDPSSVNGTGARLRAASGLIERAQLADRIPGSAGSNTGQLSPRAESALRLLWQEMQGNPALNRCPLTNDGFEPHDIEKARVAQTHREQQAFASQQWQSFTNDAAVADAEVGGLLKSGNAAEAIELIRSARTEIDQIKTSGLAPAASAFWTDSGKRARFAELHEQVAGLAANLTSTDRTWLVERSTVVHLNPVAFLDRVASLENERAKLGPETTVAASPFEPSIEPLVHSAQEAIVAEDGLAVALLQAPTVEGDFAAPASRAAATDRRAQIVKVLAEIPSLQGQHAALSATVQNLRGTLFPSAKAEEAYGQLTARLVDKTLAERCALCAKDALAAAKELGALQVKESQLAPWGPDYGPAPVDIGAAKALLSKTEHDDQKRTQLDQRVKVVAESLAHAEEATSRLLRSVFDSSEQAGRYTALVTQLAGNPELVDDLSRRTRAASTALANAISLRKAADLLVVWNRRFGDEPTTADVAQARLAALEKEATDLTMLKGKLTACRQGIARVTQNIERMKQRADSVAHTDEVRERFKRVQRFLQPENGPRVLMSAEFLDIVSRANEILEEIGADRYLVGTEDFELLIGDTSGNEGLTDAAETGGSKGNLCGIALALALLDHYNASTSGCGVGFVAIDEPTICVRKSLIPSLLTCITSQGRRANAQTLIVEHEPSSTAYVDKVITIEG